MNMRPFKIMIWFLFYTILSSVFKISECRFKFRSSSKCGSELKMLNCDMMKDDGSGEVLLLSRLTTNEIRASYTPGDQCKIKSSLFDWVLFDDNGKETHYANYSGRETYLLPPYSHDTGIHLISVYVYEHDDKGNFLDALLSGCVFEIKPEQPKLVISEGPERSVEANQIFEVSARESVDMNVPRGKQGHLTFQWSCETKNSPSTDFCKLDNKFDEPSVFVPSLFVTPNAQFIFRVSVKSIGSDWVNGTQKINVVQGATIVKIVCLKNCFPLVPLTKAKSKTIVKAQCLKGCQKLGSGTETHKWTLSEKTGSWTSGEEITGDTYLIKKDTLTPGSEYLLKCVPNVENGAPAYLEIKTHKPGKLNSCSVTPRGGKAFKTVYTVTCDYTGSGYIWTIYSIKDNAETLLSRGTDLKYMTFILGPNTKIKAKMTDKYQYSDYKILDVEVDPLVPQNSSPEEIAKKFDDMLFKNDSNHSISKLLDNKRFDDVLSVINAAVDEVADHKHENIKKLEKKVLQAVKMIPSSTNERNKQKASVVNKIVTKYIDKPDPEISKTGTEICESSARENLKFLQKERFPHDLKSEILDTASILANCSQAASNKNEELLIPENITLPTTAHSLLEIPSITENYPDYLLDLNVTKNIKQLKQSVYNMIKICYTVSKTVTTVMITEEESQHVDYNQFQVSAKKYSGTQDHSNKIFSQDVELSPSEDLLKYNINDVDVLLCTSKTSPFWWNEKTICTDVAMIKFETKGQTISSFEKPFEITFRTNDKKENVLKQYEAFPKRDDMGHPRNREEEDFQKLTIYRVDVFKHTDYIVEFFNLTSTDSFDVFISYFEKPSYSMFQEKKTTISLTKTKLLIEHEENINAWYYLSLLKNKNTMTSEEYKFSIYYFSCYKWDYLSEDWIYSCKATVSSSLENITCLCYNSSVLVGHINNAHAKLQETLMMELELTFQPSFIIFITLMVTFGLYCILLSIFAVLDKVVRKPVYFLGDIPSYCQYGYLIIVKTANRRNAGTTSNVMIKLHGSRSESDEHVLNYPDPDMNMLRKNQTDWFFLATEHYLDELTEIDVWIDSIGESPTWNCSRMEIIDLQKRKYWRFDINALFSVKEEHIFFASSPTKKDKPSKVSVKDFKSLLNLLSQVDEPHLWNIFTEDTRLSKPDRLSIMFSICLTTYVSTLFFYGWPHLKYSDMLGQFIEYGFYPQVILGSFVSLIITSLIHVPIIWTLRMAHDLKRNDHKNLGKIKHWDKRIPLWNTVCWSLLIFIIISCTILLLIFGFWVPHVTGLLWLTTSIISLLVYIAILENVFRIVTTLYFKHISREEEIFLQMEEILEYVQAQREMLYKKFGPLLLRPYFQHLYKTPDDDFIKEKKFKANIKEQIFELVEDLLMILMYVVLLYIIVLYGRDQMDYQSNKETRELVSGIHARSFNLDDVKTMTEFYIYLTESLIYSTQSPYWYGEYLARNPGMTIDYSNKYIGVARLRQHRSDNSSCSIPEKMKFQNSSCISDFRTGPVYGNFSEEWGNNQQSDPNSLMKDSWKYTSAIQAGTLGHSGVLEYYPGGGYIMPLGRTHRNSAIVVHYILQSKWLDRLTRALFVEFLMYSSSSNLFNSVTVIFENSPTGYMLQDLHVNTARLLLIKENTGLIIWIVHAVFMIMIITLTVKIVFKVIHKKKIYLKDLMHLLDIVIICLSITCVFLYAYRARMVGEFLKKLEASKHNQFVNYFHLYYSNWIFTILAALLVFLATLRLWNLLKFLLIIKIVEKTLVLCIKPILCVCLWQIVVLSSYGIAGVILFGDDFYSFRDFSSSFLTLLMRSLGFDQSFNIESLESHLQFTYYISFMLINLLINTLYVAIITISYYDAQVVYSNTEEDTLIDFLKAKVYFYWKLMTIRIRNSRLRGGVNVDMKEEGDKFVFPKLDEHRFAQCLTSPKNKMEAMVCVSLCVLRKMNRRTSDGLNTADKELMKNTLVGLFRDDSSDNDIFYISNLQGFKKALIDDDVFVKMEKVVKYLVSKEQGKKTDRYKELYGKLCQVQKSKINRMSENLNLILRIVKQIEFDDMF